jgi:hypothetical protein
MDSVTKQRPVEAVVNLGVEIGVEFDVHLDHPVAGVPLKAEASAASGDQLDR